MLQTPHTLVEGRRGLRHGGLYEVRRSRTALSLGGKGGQEWRTNYQPMIGASVKTLRLAAFNRTLSTTARTSGWLTLPR